MTNIASRLRTEEHSNEWLRERLDYMTQFLTEERKEVLSRTLAMRTHYMRILTENMFHPQNASAIMRHCEAFGIQQIHTVGNSIRNESQGLERCDRYSRERERER